MRSLSATFFGLAILVPTVVWALGSDHPQQPVNNPRWPQGLAAMVNAENREHGYSVNWEDVFFFKGDTADLNDFLQEYSTLTDTKLEVVLHPGNLEVRSPWDKQPRDLAADWQLYASPFSRDQVRVGGVEPGPFVTRVDVWLGGAVELSELDVPASVSIRSSGEIEAFVQNHRENKKPVADRKAP